MTTYTWIGLSAPWTSVNFWTVGGVSDGSVPGANDTAIVAAAGSYTISVDTASVGTLVVSDVDATVQVKSNLQAGTVSNAGSINILAGATIAAGGINNTGKIGVGLGSWLNLGQETTSGLGVIDNQGTVLINRLDNTGGTLSAAAFGNLQIYSITNGVVRNDGGTLSLFGGSLDGVTFQGPFEPTGPLNISNGFAVQTLAGGLPGTILMDVSDYSSLTFTSSQTLNNMTLNLYGHVNFGKVNTYRLTVNGTLTFGPDLIIHSIKIPDEKTGAPFYSLVGVELLGSAIIANGSIDNNADMYIGAANFNNNGTISDLGGKLLISGSSFSNTGVLTTTGGALSITSSSFSNTNVIIANAGTLSVSAPISGVGFLGVDNGGTLSLSGSYGQQIFSLFRTGNLIQFSPLGGTNTMYGFVPGDTIELVGTPAIAVFTNGTLAMTNGAFTFGSFVMSGVPDNAQFHSFTDTNNNTFVTETVACFAAGTRIRTPSGEVAVEDLRAGMAVVSVFGGSVEVGWIGRRRIECSRYLRPQAVWPVLVQAGAFGPGLPARDLRLSPDHAVYVDGVLIPVRLLLNGRSIMQQPVAEVTYLHVELPSHDVILAEGLPAESYLDTGNRADFANGGPPCWQPAALSWHVWDERGCAELVLAGPRLDAVRNRLDAILCDVVLAA